MAGSYRADDDDLAPVNGARILVVESRFNEDIVELLREGAVRALEELGADVTIVTVPGALELAPGAAIALDAAEQAGRPYEGVVALGCVIRGDTYHFEIVANESARALTDLAVARRLPLGNGVLTVDNEEQAAVRADPSQGGADKGGDAALAALALVRLKRKLGGAA
jgi:6,7-dimethyl-8-ribityllumazine synthase